MALLLGLVTVAYAGGALYVGFASTDWRRSDTFSAIAGGIFFIISTLFAVALDERAKATEGVSRELRGLVSNQEKMLVKLGVAVGVDLTTVALLPASVVTVEGLPVALSSRPSQPDKVPRQMWRPRTLEKYAWLSHRRSGRRELEAAIDTGAAESVVRERFEQSQILALGRPVRGPTGRLGEESDILHFTVDDPQGKEVVFMPVFTRFSALIHAQRRNPDWKKLQWLGVDGKQLLSNVDADVTVVINPWEGPLEYRLSRPLSSETAPKTE